MGDLVVDEMAGHRTKRATGRNRENYLHALIPVGAIRPMYTFCYA
jgi:hypothetical protein